MRKTVFISYSRKDADWLTRLQVHLKPLARGHDVDVWDDTRIKAGDRWREEIEAALDRAVIAIILVSADLLASDFVWKEEMPKLLGSARDGGLRLLPVLVRPCLYEESGLAPFQTVNREGPALAKRSLAEQDEALADVARAVLRAVREAEPPRELLDRGGGDAILDAAVDLDRSAQWGRLVEVCQSGGARHGYLLLHGEQVQGLGLFCNRVKNRLWKRVGEMQIVELRYNDQGTYARTVSLWSMRLEGALKRLGAGGEKLAPLLGEATRHQPLLVLLHLSASSPMEGPARDQLAIFLGKTLPEAIAASGAAHAVRLLAAVEQRPGDASLVEVVRAAMAQAPGLRFERLPKVTFPDDDEIATWLARQTIDGKELGEDHWVVKEVIALYQSLRDEGGLHFRHIATTIDDHLAELRAAAAGGDPDDE